MKLTPLRIILAAVGLFLFIGIIVLSVNWFQARAYDKARREFEVRDKTRAEESAKLKARAEAAEARVAEAEPKLLAYKALEEDKKRLDESIGVKIENVVTEANREAAITNTPTDCATRSQRICTKFHSLKPPIDIDCGQLLQKCNAGR